jgi:hypothetical protein
MPRTRGQAAAEANEARSSLLDTIAALVFAYLPLSVQAITLPALSKAWKGWAQEDQRANERTLAKAERLRYLNEDGSDSTSVFYVPLWAAQQQQQPLSVAQKLLFQLRAVATGDVSASRLAWRLFRL